MMHSYCLRQVSVIAMVAWDGAEVAYCRLPRVSGWASVNLSHLFAHHSVCKAIIDNKRMIRIIRYLTILLW